MLTWQVEEAMTLRTAIPPPVGITSADEGAAEWVARSKEKLSATQTTAFEIAKLRTDLDRTLVHLVGDDNPFLNDFWGGQIPRKEEELKAQEAGFAAARDKIEKERQANAAAEQASFDMVESERILLEAQKTCEAQKISAPALKRRAEEVAEEDEADE